MNKLGGSANVFHNVVAIMSEQLRYLPSNGIIGWGIA